VSASMVLTITLCAGLAVVALAVGLLARAYSHMALGAGLAGLLATTAAVTWTALAGPMPPPPRPLPLQVCSTNPLQPLELILTKPVTIIGTPIAPLRTKLAAAYIRNAALTVQKSRSKREMIANRPPYVTVDELKKRLAERKDAKLLPDKQLVTGLRGDWYRISLEPDGKNFEFRPRMFKNSDTEQLLQASIRQLQQEILGPLVQLSVITKLFVVGTADTRTVVNSTDIVETPAHRFIDGQRPPYTGDVIRRPVEVKIPNEALPDLRAAWFRDQVLIALADPRHNHADVAMLENVPDGTRRTVDIILYVKWPN
jgi:hypothetical protein